MTNGIEETLHARPGRMPGIPRPQPRPAGRQAVWDSKPEGSAAQAGCQAADRMKTRE